MALADQIAITDAPQAAFLFESRSYRGIPLISAEQIRNRHVLYFQYWPQSLQDDYQVEYAEHTIPGGSHPLYQWVGGRGRTISFQAVFTSEIDETKELSAVDGQQIPFLTPSGRYTVDVDAALSMLRGWMLPIYGEGGRLGFADPPPILTLALKGTKLAGAGSRGGEVIKVILRSSPITYESWFPNGRPRIATVDLTFNEVVQNPQGSGGSTIKFIDRRNFANNNYEFRGLGDRPILGGGI